MIRRETLPDGTWRLSGDTVSFVYQRLQPGVMLVKIIGRDTGALGDAPIDELSAEVGRYGRLALFVDISGATGVTTPVTEAWTAWFRANQGNLKRVGVLAATRFFYMEAELMRMLSRSESLMRSYTDRAEFEAAIARELAGTTPSPAR